MKDWKEFDRYPENTCYCKCGAIFRSHTQLVRNGDSFMSLSRRPCPNCESNHSLRRISSDPESFTIGGGDDNS